MTVRARLLLRYLAGWFRFVVAEQRPVSSVEPIIRPAEGDHVRALISHIHQWGPCKWNGQYWYARCVWSESCPARIAC